MDKLTKDVEDLNRKIALVLLESKVAEDKVKEMEANDRKFAAVLDKVKDLDGLSRSVNICTERVEKLEGRLQQQQPLFFAQISQIKAEIERLTQNFQEIGIMKKELDMVGQNIGTLTEDFDDLQNRCDELSEKTATDFSDDAVEKLKSKLTEKGFAPSLDPELEKTILETREKLNAMDALWVDTSARLKEFSNQQEKYDSEKLNYVTQQELENSIKEVSAISNSGNLGMSEQEKQQLAALLKDVEKLQDEFKKFSELETRLSYLAKSVERLESTPRPVADMPLAQPVATLSENVPINIYDNPKPENDLGFELDDLLQVMIKHQASDLHLKGGAPPTVRLEGDLVPVGAEILSDKDCTYLVVSGIPKHLRSRFLEQKDIDFAYSIPEARFRVNAFLQKGSVSASYRMLKTEIPSIENLRLPTVIKKLASINNGLLLVTGPAGSGKSTTLASIVDYLNTTSKLHIVTVEDPIEYVHTDKMSLVTQREIGTDTPSFLDALRSSLRQDPNVILIGEMRDPDTIFTATIAAETGHLVMSTLHTPNTVQAIQRIIDVFSGEQQKQFRLLLSSTLKGVISQRLLTRQDGTGRVPAVEIMVVTPTISSLIADSKLSEIYPLMVEGKGEGMQTFTQSLTELVEAGIISKEDALYHAEQRTEFRLGVEGHTTGGATVVQEDSLMSWL